MKYTGIAYDSRNVRPGDIFVAIPGAKHDGAAFIPQAIANGAKIIIAEKEVLVPAGVKFRKVASARRALADLACEFYEHPSRKLKVIGITGTNGKTTTAYLIRSILEKAGHKVGIIGTIDSNLTTPQSLDLQKLFSALLADGYTYCVMEVSSHALAQERVYETEFAMAIFTNLTHDHLDFHKSMDDYLNTKLKLFRQIAADGVAIINIDDPYGQYFVGAVRGEVITYGITQARHELRNTRQNEFDTKITDILIKPALMTLKINSFSLSTPLIGMHNVYNIAAAFQCGLACGIAHRVIKQGIEALKKVPGRGERVNCGQPFEVIVDFAHSPDSLQKLIKTYRPLTRGKIILVFGCPGERDRAKRPIMGKIAAELSDYSIVTTDDPHGEEPQGIIDEILQGIKLQTSRFTLQIDRETAIRQALQMAKIGDTVLLAGRGHEKFQDFAGRKVAIDDRAVAQKVLYQIIR